MVRRIVYLISYGLDWLGKFALIALMLVVLATIFLRKLLLPAVGFFEIVCLLGITLYLCTWAYTQVQKGHIRADILVRRFPRRVQSVVDSITYLLSLGACFLMSWSSIRYADLLQAGGQIVSHNVAMPLFIIACMIAFAFILLGVVVLIDLLDSLTSIARKK